MRLSLGCLFRAQGWRVEGPRPIHPKFVLIGAPHTSNWDFVCFIGAADALGLELSFLGKSSLFRWPIAGALRDLGGVPVNRSRPGDVVGAMTAEFDRRDRFILTIAPEGSRALVQNWKTGFYSIALAAGVPIVCGSIDYPRKVITIGPTLTPSGDYQADMKEVQQFYRTAAGRHPERASPVLSD